MKNLKSNFGFGTIRYLLTICTLFGAYAVNSQNGGVAITDDGSNPDASAMLDVKSTSKGVLVPRLNFLQISAIDPVADGLLIYNTDLNNFWYYDGDISQWIKILKTGQESKWEGTGNIYYTGGNVGIGTSATPLSELTIHGGSGSTNNVALTLDVDGTDWYVGVDDSDGDKFKIGTGASVGANSSVTVQSDGKVGIGTTAPEATLEVEGTMKVFGAWLSRSEGTVYQAQTDGFVVAGLKVTNTAHAHITAIGYTDSNSPPITERGYICVRYETYADNVQSSFTMPVRKGDYWKVDATYYYGAIYSFIYWIPLGVND